MKTSIIFLVAIIIPAAIYAQDDEKEQFIHRGLFRAMGTISEGAMLSQGVTNIYLAGNIEYYISDNISLRGESFYFVSTMGDIKPFEYNHSIFSGASYHFKTKNHFDPYLGIAPGISLTKMKSCWGMCYDLFPSENSTSGIDPLVSSVIGFNLYFPRWFHLFMETRYVYGRHLADYAPVSLSELRFSFGLGFNLNFIKKEKV